MIIGYTKAPACYDGFGTKRISLAVDTAIGMMDEVHIEEENLEWQKARYLSGGHGLSSKEDLNTFLKKKYY